MKGKHTTNFLHQQSVWKLHVINDVWLLFNDSSKNAYYLLERTKCKT